MPCSQRKARLLLKEGKAKIIGYKPFTIQLLSPTGESTQDVHIGVDTSDTFPNTKAYTPIRIEDVYEKAKTFIDNNKRNNSWI